jgi:hypothetical protein
MDEDGERIAPNKNRALQASRAGKRKLFKGKLRQEFLEWFAATANCAWSAARTGIDYRTVWKHRMNDPSFAEAYDRALDQGLARVRAKLIETKATAIPLDGDYDAPELQEIDPQVGLTILREYGHGLSGPLPGGRPRKVGRAPRVASNAEVRTALLKALKIYRKRIKARSLQPPADGPLQAGPAPEGGGGAE